MRRWWHNRHGYPLTWTHPGVTWVKGDLRHWFCSCGKDWWAR